MEINLDPVIESLSIRAKSRQVVANEYGICVHTLNTRLLKVNIILEPGLIFPNTLRIIYKKLGAPNNIKPKL